MKQAPLILNDEQSLIGCAVLAPDETRQSCGWLKADIFSSTGYQEFWKRFTAGEEPYILATDLGFRHDAVVWMNEQPSYTFAPDIARRLAQQAYLSGMNGTVAKLSQSVGKGRYADTMNLIRELAAQTPVARRAARNAIDVGEAFLQTLESDLRNIMTFIPALDSAVSGLERQTLSVLAGRPAMGKSALAFQIARNVAVSGQRVLFASMEMSETNLWARAACGAAGVTWRDVRAGRVSKEQREAVKDACSDLMFTYGRNLLIEDGSQTTATIWELAMSERPALIIIDHLKLFNDKSDQNENYRLGAITWQLKQMAKHLDCHVMTLAQLNRQPDMRAEKEPQLTDLRDSGEIEQNADLVLMIYRKGYYEPTLEEPGKPSPCEVWIRKARDGAANAIVHLAYDMRRQWFEARS